jgi:predicted phospho-2-dehydro-3-deoxyheptonate aldolase
MSSGKKLRLSRLFHKTSGKSLIVPMDHGATLGPIDGLVDIGTTLRQISRNQALIQGMVLHRGVMEQIGSTMPGHLLPPRILHVSASTALDATFSGKSLVARVEDALRLDADAVSIHINLGDDQESAMLKDFGAVLSACQQWCMPLLAMMYVRANGKTSTEPADIKLAARLAAELGADLVKVSYPGSAEAMREVVDGCFIPVLIAGGEKSASQSATLHMVSQAMHGGAAGVCIGRNAFQAADPHAFMVAMAEVVHGAPIAARAIHPERDGLLAA